MQLAEIIALVESFRGVIIALLTPWLIGGIADKISQLLDQVKSNTAAAIVLVITLLLVVYLLVKLLEPRRGKHG